MSRKLLFLSCVVLMLSLVGNVLAADIEWDNDNGAGDRLWDTPTNWDLNRVPNLADDDVAIMDSIYANVDNGPIILDGIDAECGWLEMGYKRPAVEEVVLTMTGGTLTAGSWIDIGCYNAGHYRFDMSGGQLNVIGQGQGTWEGIWLAYSWDAYAAMNMSGGDVDVFGGLWLGWNENSSATFNMTGGTYTGHYVYIGSWEDQGGAGRMDLRGGTMHCKDFSMGPVSHLNISGGVLTCDTDLTVANGWLFDPDNDTPISGPGDGVRRDAPGYTATLPMLAAKGRVTAYGFNSGDIITDDVNYPTKAGLRALVKIDYDQINSDMTTVWATAVDPNLAYNPIPFDKARGVQPSEFSTISWSAGTNADSHDVYVGTSFDDVDTGAGGTFLGNLPLEANSYTLWPLELGATYYWRIDEVNGTNVWKGNVWSFTTVNYLVVDDFESYSVINRIEDTWLDYWTNDTGAEVFLETQIVRDGNSIEYHYSNDVSPYYSETEAFIADLQIGPDWTTGGVQILSLWFYGNVENDAEPMWLALQDSAGVIAEVLYSGDPNNLKIEQWQQWNIPLQQFADQNLDLTDVSKISIIFGNRSNPQPGGQGTVYFDNIRLYPDTPQEETSATDPSPADGAVDVDTDATLTWTPGVYADSHDVYFGTDETAVEIATTASIEYMGNTLVNNYTPGLLELGTTYYWRIDEVNGLDIWKGNVWTFTTVDSGTPGLVGWWKFDENLGAVAYDSAGDNDGTLMDGAGWTTGVIGSAVLLDGVDDYVLFSTNAVTTTEFTLAAWANQYGQGGGYYKDSPIFSQRDYDIGDNRCSVGISTEKMEDGPASAGIRSSDGSVQVLEHTRQPYGEWHHYAMTIGSEYFIFYIDGVEVGRTINEQNGDYVTGVDYANIGRHRYITYFVLRDTGFFNGAIDDVRIYDGALSADDIWQLYEQGSTPLTEASNPNPPDGAIDVDTDVTLTWTPGVYAASHDVYFGTSFGEVNDADQSMTGIYRGNQTLEDTTYTPAESPLELGKTYYWRIDEVNGPNLWKGNVWSFTTIQSSQYLVVDDFDSYGDNSHLLSVWSDYYENDTGAEVYLETQIVHDGNSMRLEYDNDHISVLTGMYGSWTDADIADLQIGPDWTVGGSQTLSLWFYGNSENDLEPMFLALKDGSGYDAVVYYTDPNHIQIEQWQQWNIDLEDFNSMGLDLTNVSKIYIGFGVYPGSPTPGGQGTVYLDDIRLISFVTNTPPVADAGPDQTLYVIDHNTSAEVTLDGSGSYDPDEDELTYSWSIGGQEIATGVSPTVYLPVGQHTIELIVNDGEYDSEADEVVITVLKLNTPPIADAGPDQTVYVPDYNTPAEVLLDGSGSYDPDEDELTYTWLLIEPNDPNGPIIATGVNPTVYLPLGQHTIVLIVNDGQDDSEPDQVVITVVPPVEADLKLAPKPFSCDKPFGGPNKNAWFILNLVLPEGFLPEDVDTAAPAIFTPGEVESAYIETSINDDGRVVVETVFEHDEICDALPPAPGGLIDITVTGLLTDGRYFYGTATMKVMQ